MASETLLRPGEIKDILLREIEPADLHELDVEEVGTVLEVKDGVARIYGLQKAMILPNLTFWKKLYGLWKNSHCWGYFTAIVLFWMKVV